jgi:PQQ-like domain
VLWAQDDRVLMLDDRNLQAFDEADGHVVATRPLPGARTGAPQRLADGQLLVIPTAAGATLMRVTVSGNAMISEIDDKVLAECRARLVVADEAAVLTAAQDKSIRLITWNGGAFHRTWGANLPADAGQPTWLTLVKEGALIADERGAVFILSREDGRLLRRISHPSPVRCPPLIADGRLVLGDRAGNLTAYHLPPLP